MLIEPTESESKGELDRFIKSMRHLSERAKSNDAESLNKLQSMRPCAASMKPKLPANPSCAGRRLKTRLKPLNSQALVWQAFIAESLQQGLLYKIIGEARDKNCEKQHENEHG